MKALTIRQPWATAILKHGKDVENRPRRTNHIGPLAIHAGLGWDDAGIEAISRITGNIYTGGAPAGAVIGVVRVTGCHEAGQGCCWSWWAQPDAKFHITLAHPVALPEPVLCTGRLGWWNLPGDVEDEVTRQCADLVGSDLVGA